MRHLGSRKYHSTLQGKNTKATNKHADQNKQVNTEKEVIYRSDVPVGQKRNVSGSPTYW